MAGALQLLLGAAGCVGLGAVWGRAQRPRRHLPAVPVVTSQPARYGKADDASSVRVGDTVVLEGTTGRVTATIGYLGADAESWTGACVDLGGHTEWVTLVDEEHGLEVCRWTKLSSKPGKAGAEEIAYGGRTFRKRESGTADYDAHGDVDLPSVGRVKYVDYADEDQRLSFEAYDDELWEASVGRVVAPGRFTLRP